MLPSTNDPKVGVTLSGELRTCDPLELHKRLADADTPEEKRKCLIELLGIPDPSLMTLNKSLLVVAHLLDYIRRFSETYQKVESTAELLMLYRGAVTVRLEDLSDMEKTVMVAHGRRVYFRERMDWIDDLSSLFGKSGQAHIAHLAEVAYANNPKVKDKIQERMSRT